LAGRQGLAASTAKRPEETDRPGAGHRAAMERADGTWSETACTGTGFPGVYYLIYGLYKDYFPLTALGWKRQLESDQFPTVKTWPATARV
jgi:squalene cyclase